MEVLEGTQPSRDQGRAPIEQREALPSSSSLQCDAMRREGREITRTLSSSQCVRASVSKYVAHRYWEHLKRREARLSDMAVSTSSTSLPALRGDAFECPAHVVNRRGPISEAIRRGEQAGILPERASV